jgi:hypothetical protein
VADAVRDIDDPRGRSYAGNDTVHHAHELIFVSEVAEK